MPVRMRYYQIIAHWLVQETSAQWPGVKPDWGVIGKCRWMQS